ncbi:hypothetical protein Tco_0079581 [Tanacetum coccineum]
MNITLKTLGCDSDNTAKGELKDEEEVSKAQLGAFFAAMTIRANALPEPTQWSEGERRAIEAYWPHLNSELYLGHNLSSRSEGSIMRLGMLLGKYVLVNRSYEMGPHGDRIVS